MTERIRTLPDAELAVMQAVWACEAPAKRAQLAAILDKTHPMAPTTLLTVLSRLADKGFLRIEKTGRSAEYWPLVAREDYLARQGRKFYDKLCGGSVSAFAAHLAVIVGCSCSALPSSVTTRLITPLSVVYASTISACIYE